MLKLLINNGDGKGAVDYTRYVIPSSIDVEDSINVPTLTSFTLVNIDGLFKVPVRSAYVQLLSTLSPVTVTGNLLATGFITNEIQRKFIGVGSHPTAQQFQHYEYDVKVTSDEYMLNCKAVPFLSAYINRTMGQIITDLANVLMPGYFDTSNVGPGDMVPFYQYDPSSKWSDIAKEFADQAQYRYKVIGKKIYFQPYGDAPLGISYDESVMKQSQFAPAALDTGILSVPLVNDALVIGEPEPQQMWDDLFVGDGFTGNFPLKYQMFHGDTDLLLQDDWTEQTFNMSMWNTRDLFGQFILAGALNVVANQSQVSTLGQTYIMGKNGVELGGHAVFQHGEIQFNANGANKADSLNNGIVGGLYQNTSNLNAQNCIAGFSISSNANTISLTASGTNGILIQPMISGALVGAPVVSKQNHHYILQTYVTARRWSRYNQIYRTLAGTPFGDNLLPANAEVTFTITDVDLAQAYNVATLNNPYVPQYTPTITRYTASGLSIPSFAAYVLLNSQQMNLTLNYTMMWQPPTALLQVAGLTGARPINALAFSGGQMPLFDPNDPLAMPDTAVIGPMQNYPLGFGLNYDITGTVGKSGNFDQLQFYSDRIPGVGARLRLQGWESGRAVSRVQAPVSISSEAQVVGDNGLRSAIITDMKPTPRTSDECDLAAAAVLLDRANAQYDGTYTVEGSTGVMSYFWDKTKDFPRSGRYFYVTAPQRGISGQNFLVRQVKISLLEMFQEIYQFQVSFGQDLYLEKLLRRFVDQPANITSPTDTANPPDPQNLPAASTVFTTYLGNLQDAKISFVNGTQVKFDLGSPPITGVEVRRSDSGWASNANNLIGVFTTQTFTLPRAGIDQIWYMRQVNGAQTSRFTRAFHVNYPMVPSPPSMVLATLGTSLASQQISHPVVTVSLPVNFDKNIYGVQLDTGPLVLQSAQVIQVVSDDPTDHRQVAVYGDDSNGNPAFLIVTLNGTTPVTVGTFKTLQHANILS